MGIARDEVDERSGDWRKVVVLLAYGRDSRLKFMGAIALVILGAVSVILSGRLLGSLVEALVAGEDILFLASAVLVLELTHILFVFFGRVSIAYLTNIVAYKVRKNLFAKLARIPTSYFDQQPMGRTLTRLTSDVEGIEDFFNHTLTAVLIALMSIVIVFVAMIATDPSFGLMTCLTAVPALAMTLGFRKMVGHWFREFKKRNSAANAYLAELLHGLKVVKILGLESWTQARFGEKIDHHFASAMKVMNWNSFLRPMSFMLCTLPTVFVVWYGGHAVIEGSMALGVFVAFTRYSERFLNPIVTLSHEVQRIQDAITSSERIVKLLDESEEDDEFSGDGRHSRPLTGAVSFRDVRMCYQGGPDILKGISLDIEAGQTVAFVGATGSGKTTTMHLIPRLYPYQSGLISIDGVPLEEWQRRALRNQLGIVSQDVVVARGTLRQNLISAMPEGVKPSQQMVMRACEQSGLVQIMDHFPRGLDTWIVDGGDNLSMGERQLVSFTRMFLRDPALLLLDEATANIDETCEEIIQDAVERAMEGRTCIIIAHRLSTIRNCDKIFVFDSGQIIEQGDHAELLAADGHYASLVKAQI